MGDHPAPGNKPLSPLGPLRTLPALFAGLAFVLLPAGPAAAQENSDCITCHGEKDITGERKGRTVSVYVSEKGFAASIHGGLACVNCHVDLEGKELPHETPLQKVDCSGCHEAEVKEK